MEEIKEYTRASDLLASSTIIRQKYEQLAKLSGEAFNIFEILNVGTNEVRLHSAFIADLLNPKGSHGQNEEFLKLFLKTFNIDEFSAVDLSGCSTAVEYYIDRISHDFTEGGRIDILIESSCCKRIVIENKIYAADQANQLLRYKNAFPDAIIIYLTLDGMPPSVLAKGNMRDEDFLLKSYKDDLLAWLKYCHEKAASSPMLRECLQQYINLIKSLTGQTTNKTQMMEVKSLILESEEKFKAAELISTGLAEIKSIIDHCEKKALESWSLKYSCKEVHLFTYFNYKFYVKLSTEWKYTHFDFFALKDGVLNCANDSAIQIFRQIAKQFENRTVDKHNFFENENYLVWVWSQNDLRQRKIDYDKLKSLINDCGSWVKAVLREGDSFIEHIRRSVLELKDDNIILDRNSNSH